MIKKIDSYFIILLLLHIVGVFGLSIKSTQPYFLLLVPLNIVISAILLFLRHQDFNKFFAAFFFSIFNLGFAIEVLGVTSGQVFGEYFYSNILGLSFYGVPVLIGLLWLTLVYSTGVIAQKLKSNIFVKSAFAAVLMVLLDLVMEPVAIKLGFWTWEASSIPLRNYAAWFIISFVFQLIFNVLPFKKDNNIALPYYLIQFGFFLLLFLIGKIV